MFMEEKDIHEIESSDKSGRAGPVRMQVGS